MELFLFSLKISALIVAGFAALVSITAGPRFYILWRRTRMMTLSMPCTDPLQARFRISEAFKGLGSPTTPGMNGSFTIEPAGWRKMIGLKPITVDFPQPQLAFIRGQANALKNFARSAQLPLVPAPNSSFGDYFKPMTKWIYGFLAVAFVGIFLLILINDPNHIATRHAQVPTASSTRPEESR